MDWTATFTDFAVTVEPAHRRLLADPMTSGGLLAAVPAGRAEQAEGWVVGRLVAGPAGAIRVA